jgi:hypothetical protein
MEGSREEREDGGAPSSQWCKIIILHYRYAGSYFCAGYYTSFSFEKKRAEYRSFKRPIPQFHVAGASHANSNPKDPFICHQEN